MGLTSQPVVNQIAVAGSKPTKRSLVQTLGSDPQQTFNTYLTTSGTTSPNISWVSGDSNAVYTSAASILNQ